MNQIYIDIGEDKKDNTQIDETLSNDIHTNDD